MIHDVRGTLREKGPGRVVVDLGGLGLEILVSDQTWNEVGGPGEPVRLLTHLAVREDAWTLFGFAREDERIVFRMLLGVQRVGPRLALAILSGVSAASLRRAVEEGDVASLAAVSGLGPKTAQRIIVDLRDKVGQLPGAARVIAAGEPAPGGDEAVDALVALGYSRGLAREAVRAARETGENEADSPEEKPPVEVVVREALRRI